MTVMWRIAGNWEPWVVTLCLELKYLRASWRGSGKICGIGPNISHHLRNQEGIELENFLSNIENHEWIEFWTFVICEQLECWGMSPTFATDETCDYELVIEDYWGVALFVHNIFYSSRLFLDEDALVELNVFLWVFWEEMPSFGQDFHGKSQRILDMNQMRFNIGYVLDKWFFDIRGPPFFGWGRRGLLGLKGAKRIFYCVWGDLLGAGATKAEL